MLDPRVYVSLPIPRASDLVAVLIEQIHKEDNRFLGPSG
jgi:hypothetical protein